MRTINGVWQCLPLVIGENIPYSSWDLRSCIVREYQHTSLHINNFQTKIWNAFILLGYIFIQMIWQCFLLFVLA